MGLAEYGLQFIYILMYQININPFKNSNIGNQNFNISLLDKISNDSTDLESEENLGIEFTDMPFKIIYYEILSSLGQKRNCIEENK